MRKALAFLAISVLLFLAWPSLYERMPECPYDDVNRCALFDPAPQLGKDWFSGYRLVRDFLDEKMTVKHTEKLGFNAIGRGTVEDFNFNWLAPSLIVIGLLVAFWPKNTSYSELMIKYNRNNQQK